MLENENMIDLFGAFKEMSSERISQLIQEETAKKCPNDDLVLMALDILENREKENPVELGSKGMAAWKKYKSKVRSRQQITVLIWKPMIQVASVLLVITLIFTLLPTQANAETWWERLARWTDDFFSFFNTNASENPEEEYVFQTDNEGLQQVYDAVSEFGILEPVVPMWFPYMLEVHETSIQAMPTQKYLHMRLSDGHNEVVYVAYIFDYDKANQYYKNDTNVDSIERYGTIYNILNNQEKWTVVWSRDNYECAFTVDCQKDDLYKIIESIYRWRKDE